MGQYIYIKTDLIIELLGLLNYKDRMNVIALISDDIKCTSKKASRENQLLGNIQWNAWEQFSART